MQYVILFDNGDVLALGYMQSLENYNERIFLYYIDKYGTLVWRESFASKEDHPLVLERIGYKIQQIEKGYIINGWCAYPYPGNPGTGYTRPFFIQIDSAFNEKCILPFGITDSIMGEANDVIPLNDSVYMGVGYMWVAGSKQNSLYMFFNENGEELGYTQITNEDIGPEVQTNIPSSISRINDTLFISSVWYGPGVGYNSFGELLLDTAGNIYNLEPRPNSTGISTLIKTFDNKYVIGCSYKHTNSDWDIYLYKINDSLEMDTVYPGNYVYDSLCPYQIESGIIDITDCMLITDVGGVPTPKEYFAGLNTIPIKAYPNPVNMGEITLEMQNTEHHEHMQLKCFDVFGKEVHSEKVYQFQGASKINISKWNEGMYIAIIFSDNKVVGQSKFVVQ